MSAPSGLFDIKLALDEDSAYCPVRATLALLGLKWVPRIIYELMNGKRRFNELACAVGGCNSRTLRDRLKGLEDLGIIEREVIAVMPPWVEYGLTEKGMELGNALRRLEEWGRSHMTEPEGATFSNPLPILREPHILREPQDERAGQST